MQNLSLKFGSKDYAENISSLRSSLHMMADSDSIVNRMADGEVPEDIIDRFILWHVRHCQHILYLIERECGFPDLQRENETLRENNERLQHDISAHASRRLTWRERLFGRTEDAFLSLIR